ncbi:MAG: MaoC/PaaZ C-terminal domain-containing protein [Pseudomonadota bacterium]
MSTPSLDRMSQGFTPGSLIGISDWIPVTQEMIDAFGVTTLDPDPMHIDPRWAAANGPFGGTIAFGFLTIALLTRMFHDATGLGWDTDPAVAGYNLNYGFDRLRLVSPIPAGARVRGHFVTAEVRRDDKGRRITAIDCEIEIEDADRPALVARWLTAWVPPSA